MATEQYFEDKKSLDKWDTSSDTVTGSDIDGPSAGFDCNICLDSVQDPVVTLCGHLYCWPCIYKWLHFQTISDENLDQKPHQCPVCKAEVSDSTLIPLYGRGLTTTKALPGNTPKRPLGPAYGVSTLSSPITTNSMQFPQPLDHHGYSYQPQIDYAQQGGYPYSSMLTSVPDPVTRMFGDMVFTRVLGNSTTNLYTYPNSYNLTGITSRRIRRRLMQADKSLSRISFFLFCCIFFCLLLF